MKKITRILTSPFRWFKRRSTKGKVIVAVVVLGIVGGIAYQMTRPKNGNYEVVTPEYKSLVEIVTETGNVVSTNVVPIYSSTNGIVTDVYVNNGSIVTKGQDLASVVSSATDQEKSSALSVYLASIAALKTAQAEEYSLQASMFAQWDEYRNKYEDEEFKNTDDTDRNEPEFQVPQKQWLASESLYKKQQGLVSSRQADVAAKKLSYDATQDSVVRTPIDGTVQNLSTSEGQGVVAYTPTFQTEPIMLIMTPSPSIIKVAVNETDYSLLAEDQPVIVSIDALDDKEFEGRLLRFDAVGTNTQGVITYNVYIELIGDTAGIRPGMTATADIEVARKDNVLTVPSSAVKPYQGGKAVRVVDESGEVSYVPVTVGIKGDESIEILSGIDESTEVITALKNEQIDRKGGSMFGG